MDDEAYCTTVKSGFAATSGDIQPNRPFGDVLQAVSCFTLISLLGVCTLSYVGKRRFDSTQSTTPAPVDNVAACNGYSRPRFCANRRPPIAEIAAGHATIAATLQPTQLIITQNTQRSMLPAYFAYVRYTDVLARFRLARFARLQVSVRCARRTNHLSLRSRSRSLQSGTLCVQ